MTNYSDLKARLMGTHCHSEDNDAVAEALEAIDAIEALERERDEAIRDCKRLDALAKTVIIERDAARAELSIVKANAISAWDEVERLKGLLRRIRQQLPVHSYQTTHDMIDAALGGAP